MSFITSPGVIVPPLTAGGVAYGTGSQAKVTAAGTAGQVLTSNGAGVPVFAAVAANVSSFSAGSTGLTPATATTGAVALAGTLAVGNGGTSLATLTANNVIIGNGASAPLFVAPGTSGNVLLSNGTTWTSAAAAAAGFTLGTEINLTGTSALFTGIPATVKVLYVMFRDVTYTAPNTDPTYSIRLGTSGGLQTGQYVNSGFITTGGGAFEIMNFSENQRILLSAATLTNSTAISGSIVFNLMNSSLNTYTYSGVIGATNTKTIVLGGLSDLPNVLTQLSFELVNSTFASGAVNIAFM